MYTLLNHNQKSYFNSLLCIFLKEVLKKTFFEGAILKTLTEMHF